MTKLRCAVLDDYQNVALTMADWAPVMGGVEIRPFHQHFDQEDDLVHAIEDCEIVVIMRERTPFGASLFARLPQLKLLVTTGMRNASVDLVAAKMQEVAVCGTGTLPEPPTELTWALILGLARNLAQENHAFHTHGPWQNTIGRDLHGKRLGLLGLGKLGALTARVGAAFGMEITAWSQNLTRERADEVGVGLASTKEELLETSDFVSIHLVLSDRTRGMIGNAELQRMRRSAYLINTSRAQIVDQAALVEALQNNWIAGAGLDVFDMEPLPGDHPLRSLPNVLATPHLGYVTEENYRLYYREIVEDIVSYLAGSPIRRIA